MKLSVTINFNINEAQQLAIQQSGFSVVRDHDKLRVKLGRELLLEDHATVTIKKADESSLGARHAKGSQE